MIKIGIIGCGHWGKNYLRVFSELPNTSVIEVCDEDLDQIDYLRPRYSYVKITTDFKKLLSNPKIDAVVVSTPSATHCQIAKAVLLADKHLMVEKPLSLRIEEGEELVRIAERKKKILMVAHTFLYNPAIRKMKKYIQRDDFGEIYYLQARRTHLGLIRKDVNAIWDLAPHDVSIFSYLLNALPLTVSAVGGRFLGNYREDAGFIILFYPKGIIGNIHVSWIDTNKVREVVVVGSKKRIVFDDLNNLEKIRVFEKGVAIDDHVDSFGEFQILLRDGDIISPKIKAREPLKEQCSHFLECIEKRKSPLTDGTNGLDVVRVMVAIEESIKRNGTPVKVRNEKSDIR
jgi:predicted dehydrogenase